MLFKSKKAVSLILALAMVLCMLPVSVFAADEVTKLAYAGDSVGFFKDGLESAFGMLAPQEGTTCELDGDNVVIHIVPKNTSTYNALHWGAITDAELTADVSFNEDGTIDLTLPAAEYCGYGHPVAILKPDGTTASAQVYLAIPAADKLPEAEHKVEKLPYEGDAVGFFKEDLTSAFGMLTPQEGTTCELDGGNVVIHIVPKNTSVYNGLHWGAITDEELTKDVSFNEDGTIDLTLPAAEYCGYAHPIAPIKASDGATSKDQYYLAIPATDKLPVAEHKVEKIPYDGEDVAFYKEDLESAFGMLSPQEGSTWELDGDTVKIHIIPSNKTVYKGWHWGAITDEDRTLDFEFNEDGTFDLELSAAEYCGYAHPVAPIKKKDGGTTSAQYYLAIPAKDKLPVAEHKVEKLPYDGDAVAFYKEDLNSAFGMLAPQPGSSCKVDGDNVVIHIVPKNKTVYNAMHWGAITDELTKDVTFNEDGSIDLTLPAAEYCGYAHPIAPIKAKDGATSADQYYLAIPAQDKLPWEIAEEPEEPVDPVNPDEPAKAIELAVTNNVGMFKVIKATVETAEDGSKTLVVVLNGTGYENLFKGTYDEAAANGNNRDNWIKGVLNADGKFEFRIPLKDGESYIPVVTISQSYLEKFEAGENPVTRAFFPRQMELDLEAKTLVVSDYKFTKELEIVNNVKMFKPESASLTTVGGPNSNVYATTLDLLYGSDSYDKAFIGRADKAGTDDVTVVTADNRLFSFKLRWVVTVGDPDSVVDLMKEPIVVSFHSVKNDKWYEREFILSESEGKLTINEVPEEEKVIVVSVEDKDSEDVKFVLEEVDKSVLLDKETAAKVNPDIKSVDDIDEIVWQKDLTVPEGTAFPATVKFEYVDKEAEFYIYHYNGTEWEVAGKGSGGKATVTFDSLSPVALVTMKETAPEVPDTGDLAGAYMWMALSSLFALIYVARRRREEA